MIKLWSTNDWDPLESIIVGNAHFARFPEKCPTFRDQERTTKWKHSPLPSGMFPSQILAQANDKLDVMCAFLKDIGVEVFRPSKINFDLFDGMYNYCPRDRLLIIEDVVINPNMTYPTRQPEIYALENYVGYDYINCYEKDATFDAANICKVNNDILYLHSESGSLAGATWLEKTLTRLYESGELKEKYKVHVLKDIYGGVHIDSTITPLREGLVILNKDRINKINMPVVFKDWDIIWLGKEDMPFKKFHNYPYASEYIGMNVLSVNPNTVIADIQNSDKLRTVFDKYGITVCDLDFPHSRTLGGGPHCTTLDLRRTRL
jgi:N-dimethylarginine dimethylaminohydrolase